jgi:hypothetical protein
MLVFKRLLVRKFVQIIACELMFLLSGDSMLVRMSNELVFLVPCLVDLIPRLSSTFDTGSMSKFGKE